MTKYVLRFTGDDAPLAADEPSYPGSGLIYAGDSSSSYFDDLTAMGAQPYGSVARLVPSPAPASPEGNSPVDPVTHGITTGKDGVGKALDLKWPPISTVTPGTVYQTGGKIWLYRVPGTIASTKTVFMQWYSKLYGTAATAMWRYKHAHIYLAGVGGGAQPQWNTADYQGGGSLQGSPHTVYQFYGKAYRVESPDNNQGDQPFGPYFQNQFDVWVRKTISYRQHDSPSVKNGFARMWLAGVKVIDVCQANVGVTPAGGGKTWCEQNHIDNSFHDGLPFLDSQALAFWGGTITSSQTTTQGELLNIGDGDATKLTTLKVWTD